jgi:hypothetical protein
MGLLHKNLTRLCLKHAFQCTKDKYYIKVYIWFYYVQKYFMFTSVPPKANYGDPLILNIFIGFLLHLDHFYQVWQSEILAEV